MRGWVYIAENESLADMVKIGYTDSDPVARMASLSNTSVPTPFRVLYEVLIDSPYELEQLLHSHFADKRVTQGREFFRTSPGEIVDQLRKLSQEMNLKVHLEHIYFENDEPSTYTPPEYKKQEIDWALCFKCKYFGDSSEFRMKNRPKNYSSCPRCSYLRIKYE